MNLWGLRFQLMGGLRYQLSIFKFELRPRLNMPCSTCTVAVLVLLSSTAALYHTSVQVPVSCFVSAACDLDLILSMYAVLMFVYVQAPPSPSVQRISRGEWRLQEVDERPQVRYLE